MNRGDEMSTPEAEHAVVWAMIPWCVAGSASADELERAQRHVAQCADCRAEWSFNERLRRGLSAPADRGLSTATPAGTDAARAARADPADPDDPAHPAERPDEATDAALARLWQRIDADAAMAFPDERTPRRGAGGTRLMWLLAAASVLQAVGLTTLAALWWQGAGEARFETLSRDDAAPAPPVSSGPLLQLQLDPGTSPAEADALARRLRDEPQVREVRRLP